MATILKGAPVVAAMNERNAALCEQLKAKGITPTLAVVRVGEREDDLSYERGVIARCGKVGVEVKQFLLPADASQDDLLKVIAEVKRIPSTDACCSVRCPSSSMTALCVRRWLRKRTLTASRTILWPVCSLIPISAMLPAPRRPALKS